MPAVMSSVSHDKKELRDNFQLTFAGINQYFCFCLRPILFYRCKVKRNIHPWIASVPMLGDLQLTARRKYW